MRVLHGKYNEIQNLEKKLKYRESSLLIIKHEFIVHTREHNDDYHFGIFLRFRNLSSLFSQPTVYIFVVVFIAQVQLVADDQVQWSRL